MSATSPLPPVNVEDGGRGYKLYSSFHTRYFMLLPTYSIFVSIYLNIAQWLTSIFYRTSITSSVRLILYRSYRSIQSTRWCSRRLGTIMMGWYSKVNAFFFTFRGLHKRSRLSALLNGVDQRRVVVNIWHPCHPLPHLPNRNLEIIIMGNLF